MKPSPTIRRPLLLLTLCLGACAVVPLAQAVDNAPDEAKAAAPPGHPAPNTIEKVLVSAEAMALLDIPGVTGVAAGRCDTPAQTTADTAAATAENCIVIYWNNSITPKPVLPAELGGYATVVRNGGPARINAH